jgi:hypothetical protein
MKFERRDWRSNVVDYAYSRRLELSACPVSFELVLASAAITNAALVGWVRENLRNGVMLRTAQAELIAMGVSLRDTARRTGTTETYVLFTLTRLEEEEREIEAFYLGNGAS